MVVKVEIVSKENIKPSSPTPQILRSYKLSFIDQLIPAPYAPLVLYYPNQDDVLNHDQLHNRLETLKGSLSKTLTHFYPLAGTIKDNLSIDCDDIGAYFAVARVVDTRLDDFLKNPDLELIKHLLPCEPAFHGSIEGACVTNVQVNVFECHGIAIALCISHKIFDASALATFLKGWSGLSRGSKDVVIPDLISAPSLFPAHDSWLENSTKTMWGSLVNIGKCSMRRFVFDSSKLAILKAEAAKNGVKDPTRVEVVSALLWKCVMAAAEEKVGFRKPSLLSHSVNLRRRSPSTLSEDSIGNLMWIASSECVPESEIGINDLVKRVRGGVLKINDEFVKNLRSDRRREVMEKSLERLKVCGTTKDYLGFSSLCNMGYYEVDFGWGKPLWVCSSVYCDDSPTVFMNFVLLMNMRFGDGIEAWVTMDEEDMQILQHNKELMAFASLDPSPLQTHHSPQEILPIATTKVVAKNEKFFDTGLLRSSL